MQSAGRVTSFDIKESKQGNYTHVTGSLAELSSVLTSK